MMYPQLPRDTRTLLVKSPAPAAPARGLPHQRAEVARLEALGAQQASIGQGDVSWVVMADPDGNEFDVLQPLTPNELPPGHDALGRRTAAGARP
jgi:hypothetical protein